jgi:hypothetical protein
MDKILIGLLLLCGSVDGAEFKAGVARAVITPPAPIWMSGYAARKHPSEGVIHDLWAKALALEDAAGGRVVIVTTDLIGLPREVSDEVAAGVAKKFALQRAQLLLNSSHTHCGPVVWPNLSTMFDLTAEDRQTLIQYSGRLKDQLVGLVGAALADLAPAKVFCGHGSAGFAINRREPTPKGMRIGLNPKGPVDHDLPVLKVASPDGKLRAVLCGYACHNTTLGGDFYQINGDYAGFAQLELEKAHPGATAMFLILCGADQNPSPRGKLELAAQHGKSLAEEVDRVLGGELRPVRPPIRTAYEVVNLDFAPHDRAMFEEEAKSKDLYRQRRAKLMLSAYDAGHPVRCCAYPVQAVRFNSDLALIALGGEVVVDYSLRLKREFPTENLIVAGYSNEVMCYIPSLRVLREGGYEAVDSMRYYAQPGPFAENVEEAILGACREVLSRTGAKASR